MASQIPAGKNWFGTLKKSFADVPVGSDQGIDTSSFLEAAEATTSLFGNVHAGCQRKPFTNVQKICSAQ